MRDIIMSVKARHIRNMKLGLKKYELRHTSTKDFKVANCYTRIWLCESGTAGRIVATFRCRTCPSMDHAQDTTIAKLCAITAAEVQGYRQKGNGRLFGWMIEDFEDLKGTDRERHITDFGITRPPQSWCYAKVED